MEGVARRAEELLEEVPDWIWDGESLPIPVEDIADSYFGLLIRDVEDMTEAPGCPSVAGDQSISGLLLPSRSEIWVNAEEARQWPPRRRFTIGHELGHWVLHQDEQTSLFCRHGSVGDPDANDARREKPLLDLIEEQANWFAASLLMPADLVRTHYEETGGDFDRLCSIFKCSGAAMGRRLHQVV
jgi:IrrE N-terminal-like domain